MNRRWLVVQASDGRAEVHYDRAEPGLVILENGRYWQESDAIIHRDSYNTRREREEERRAAGQGRLEL